MKLKRIYDHSTGAPVLDHVRVISASDRQKFPQGLVMEACSQGWMSMADGRIVLKSDPPVAYRIARGPGRYCCHCGIALSGEGEARAHIEAKHGGEESPDPQNPAGYEWAKYFDCVKES